MLPQKNRFGKTAVFIIGIVASISLLTGLGLSLAATQNQYNNHSYFPIVFQDENSAPLPTSTSIPAAPSIILEPNCSSGPNIRFTIQGSNWPKNETVNLYWDVTNLELAIFTGDATSFSQSWTKWGLANGMYEVIATSAGHSVRAFFHIPCPPNTPTPTPTNTPSSTPGPTFTPSQTATITPTATPDFCGLAGCRKSIL